MKELSGSEKQPKAGCDWSMVNKREIDMGCGRSRSKGHYGPGLGIWVLGNLIYIFRDFSNLIYMCLLLLQGIYLILRISI